MSGEPALFGYPTVTPFVRFFSCADGKPKGQHMTTENPTLIAGRLATVNEALAMLRIWRFKFYELVKDGVIETVKFGERTTRVRVESLERLLSNGIPPKAKKQQNSAVPA